MQKGKVWIIGAGDMACQYTKVLDGLGYQFDTIGRGEESARKYEEQTKHNIIRGGIENYIKNGAELPEYAIVTVYPASLYEVTSALTYAGIKKILVEKPGGINLTEVSRLSKGAASMGAKVYVAYNRRFYASTIEAKKLIEKDGGVTSFNFEFTEWAHLLRQYEKPADLLENWFMANSTHVVDLAFYLGGIPRQISSYVSGKLDWHTRAARYGGAGITAKDATFTYKANWESAGRWSVEILTREHKYLFEPLEQLKIQTRGSIKVEPYEIDDKLDREYKPGLYLQTKAFLEGDERNLIAIEEHARITKVYEIMESNAAYESGDDWNTYKKLF